MDDLTLAIESSSITYTDFTPHSTLTFPQIIFLDSSKFLNITRRLCKRGNCNSKQKLFVSKKKYKLDGYESRCPIHSRHRESIRKYSFFYKSRLSIPKI